MADAADRLRDARLRAGFPKVADAARATKLHKQNWADHEASRRQIREHNAKMYAKALNRVAPALHLSWIWLLTGHDAPEGRKVPHKGYIGAGSQVYAIDAEDVDSIDAPPGAHDDDVSFTIRGGSMPPFREGGVVLATPVEAVDNVLFRLAVVDLDDGTRWFKQVVPSSLSGRHTLVSLHPGAEPMRDVRIVAAARFHIYIEPH